MKSAGWVVKDRKRKDVFWPSGKMKKTAWVSDESIYREAEKDPVRFWSKKAEEGLVWKKKWKEAYKENGKKPHEFEWFVGGKINAAYNALDRHVKSGNGKKTALVWVPEPVGAKTVRITYEELYDKVNRLANVHFWPLPGLRPRLPGGGGSASSQPTASLRRGPRSALSFFWKTG